ncbi:hypothetical protein GPALN_013184 [Globodera pallida]|nr:hypothetical protein GPALN_013184 [Globodera pallida]
MSTLSSNPNRGLERDSEYDPGASAPTVVSTLMVTFETTSSMSKIDSCSCPEQIVHIHCTFELPSSQSFDKQPAHLALS